MTTQPTMFRIHPDTRESQAIAEVEFSQIGFRERRDIQEWVANNSSVLGDDLLIISKEFSGFDRTNERLDLLAIDPWGDLVIIELKRDDSGADTHWQAIKYASYFSRTTADNIVPMLADHAQISEDEATDLILQHLNTDDFDGLNRSQRIILVSHRFDPEVTSAALWLNERVGKSLISCVRLVPYLDADTNSLYIQASTIIPVPDTEGLQVGIKESGFQPLIASGFAEKLRDSYQRNRNDEVTRFFRRIGQNSIEGLPADLKPDKISRWGARGHDTRRYYHLWYGEPPWSNHQFSYRFNLWPVAGTEAETNSWEAWVLFGHNREELAEKLQSVSVHPDQTSDQRNISIGLGKGSLDDQEFGNKMAETMRNLIKIVTPIVAEYVNEPNVEDA